MKRRQWDSKIKALIVLQGLKGKAVGELCAEHQISQAQYYLWRDQFLSNAAKAFEIHQQNHREQRLEQENFKLKHMLGELTLALKKTDELLGK
jgi:transposase